LRRCTAIDLHDRSIPKPDNRSGDVQAFTVRRLCQSVLSDLESARRLLRAAEQCADQDRPRTLLGLLESLDGLLVNCSIYAADGAEISEDIARTMRTLTLNARIEAEWEAANNRRAG
jgi:hypothetical protein